MQRIQRNGWFSIATLALYLAINIGARGLHHHQHADIWSADRSSAARAIVQTKSPHSADDDDEDGACAICNVLHLAQAVSAGVHIKLIGALSCKALCVVPRIRPYPLSLVTHSRAPPVHI